jgi:hypothetical protein
MPHYAFKMSGLDLKGKPMMGQRPDSGLQVFDRPDSDLTKPSSA